MKAQLCTYLLILNITRNVINADTDIPPVFFYRIRLWFMYNVTIPAIIIYTNTLADTNQKLNQKKKRKYLLTHSERITLKSFAHEYKWNLILYYLLKVLRDFWPKYSF